ncbi:MAG: pectate lyase [Williamsia sp.]|nr:pectate lyase [Williamsia sp.]
MIALLMLQVSREQAFSQTSSFTINTEPFSDNANHWYGIFDKANVVNPRPDRPKYKTTDIVEVGDNVLLYQKDNGGWPKNYDIMAVLTPEQKDSLAKAKSTLNTTFDNGTTYTHVALLAQIYAATKQDKYKESALKGLDFILQAQYKNGGWPQYFPLESNYSRHITFNDGAYIGIMRLLKDIGDNQPQFAFINEATRKKISGAYEKGLDCILKTQINDSGKPTAWCQQYDETSLQPAWARAFEPPSICNQESSDLVLFLMSIDHPSKEIIHAVEQAAAWFEASKIYNTRVKTIPAPYLKTDFRISTTDRVVVTDSTAPPIWTRYYELKTHRPLFCNRDSKVVYSLAEVARERRDGYSWYTYNPQKVLTQFPRWQKKLGLVAIRTEE